MTKYPWNKLFKKKKYTLVRGKDFEVLPHCMAQSVRNRAVREKVSVSVRILEDRIEVTNKGPIK